MSDTDFSQRPTTIGPDQAEGPATDAAESQAAPAEEVQPVTEAEEAAEIVERAEAGDEAAEVALEEAGGDLPESDQPDAAATAEPITEETSDEALAALEAEAEPEPPTAEPEEAEAIEQAEGMDAEAPLSDVTDVPTEEATLDESEAEQSLAADIIEGEDEGPLVATGVDEYVEAAAPEVIDLSVEAPETVEAEVEAAASSETPPEAEAAPEAEEPAAEAVEEAAADAVEELEESSARSIFGGPGEWYVIHTYAGYENKVKANLGSRIGSMQMEEKIFDVVIPMEDVMEIKGGKKQVVQKKVFPGYLLVKMVYDNDSWYVVRNTPGVTGFVSSGTGTKPTPLSRREVEKILAVKEETKVKPQFRLEWEEGDVVRIVAGPFADFTGTIAEINVEQSKLKVMVNIFDRETPVELAFDQVAKA
jgi:transcription termination/antitermination protein NusG